MMPPSLGDGARLFAANRQNADLRLRLATLTQEMASGQAADPAKRLGGDLAPLAAMDRRLGLGDAFAASAREAEARLSLMQAGLARAEGARASLLAGLMAPALPGSATAAEAGRAAFDDVASAFNARQGDQPLFAGTATDGAALAPASDMMAAIRAAVTGAITAADMGARLDAWFDDPAGGFATMGYLGSNRDATRPLDDGEAVALRLRADDPAPRALLKAAATAALSGDPALGPGEGPALAARARDALLSLAAPMAEGAATLGRAEARVEAAQARNAAAAAALGLMRNEALAVDPFETASAVEAMRLSLETHYALTSRLASLSLVGYLR